MMKRFFARFYAWIDWSRHHIDCLRNRHTMLRAGTFLVSYRQFGYYHCLFCEHVEIAEDRKVTRRVTPYISRQPVRHNYR